MNQEFSLTQEYYIRFKGRVQGPFTPEKLHELARKGRFSRAYQVSLDGSNWQRAGDLPDLLPQGETRMRRPPRTAPIEMQRVEEPAPVPVEDETTLPVLEPEYVADSDPETAEAETQWFYTVNHQDHGPVPLSELQAKVRAGEVHAGEQVWTEGWPDWVIAGQTAEFGPLFPETQEDPLAGFDPQAGSVQTVAGASGQETAPMAVASFVLGLLGTTFLPLLGSILAVVFGHIALRQIKLSGGQLGGQGMAVAGLILGYLIIIVAVVGGIVFAFSKSLGLTGN